MNKIINRLAKNALKYFWNKVDRYYFGNKSHRNNIKVKRMCFLQKGYSNQNLHFHFVAITPNNETDFDFIKILKRIWQYEVKESGYFSEFETIEITKDFKKIFQLAAGGGLAISLIKKN